MALGSASSNSWYHSWSAPSPHHPVGDYFRDSYISQHTSVPDHFPKWHDDTHFRNADKTSSPNPAYYLPYLLSLGLVKPDEKGQTQNTISYEKTGPFTIWYEWKQLDVEFPSEEDRQRAIYNEEFIQENNLPLGVEVYKDRLFVSMPKWKKGVPITLAVLPKVPVEKSPKLVPYPGWEWHSNDNCDILISVYRMEADECGRLWVLDSGQIDVTVKPQQVCPPRLFVFDLKTDQLLFRYTLPDEFVKQDSLYSNIRVDVRRKKCDDAFAYLADVWRFGLVVFKLKDMTSWRVTDHLFYPEPLAAAYNLHGLDFEWTDGIFGMALSPLDKRYDERILYFHPMSSFREFYVLSSLIRNQTAWETTKDAFRVLGQSRGKRGHTSASFMDRKGILFYNQVTRDSIGCWDSRKPYKRTNLGVVAYSNETLVFPNDLKVDKEKRQSIWVISNRLPIYLYQTLDPNQINFRIMSAYTDEAIKNTICDPSLYYSNTWVPHNTELEDCY